MPNNARLDAARRLQKFGWAITRYGQRIERCCLNPSAEHEKSAAAWHARALERMREFIAARDASRAQVRARCAGEALKKAA